MYMECQDVLSHLSSRVVGKGVQGAKANKRRLFDWRVAAE